jgi:hypothetical protein
MLEILLATVAAFVLGGAYYAIFATEGGEMRPWMVAVEVLRCLVLVAVVAALFVGFPLVLWVGAVVHERTPVRTAVLHGGDWLVKLLAIGAIVSV